MSKITEPTSRQIEVLDLIRRLTNQRGFAPTIRELLAAEGNTSTNGMADNLKSMRRKGLVDWDDGKARTLRITVAGYQWVRKEVA